MGWLSALTRGSNRYNVQTPGGLSVTRIARKPASESDDRRLKLYSLAAAAAGVSVLALAQPSEGEVIVTKKAIQLHAGTPATVDLNNDGLADFKFSFTIFYSSFGYKYNAKLAVKGLTKGRVV